MDVDMDMDVQSIAPSTMNGEEVKEYRVRVSSKYLKLTSKKVELTRLPHEFLMGMDPEVGKGEVEALVDYWSEGYDWRREEVGFNGVLGGFRTRICVPVAGLACGGDGGGDGGDEEKMEGERWKERSLRIHFLHIRSQEIDAVPLLLIPSFPFTNLSLGVREVVRELRGEFHVVVPCLPGLGFSDAFPFDGEGDGDVEGDGDDGDRGGDGVLGMTAEVFDALMVRLGYEVYVVSGMGSGRDEVGRGIDYWIPKILGERFKGRCLGTHFVDPCVGVPTLAGETWMWVKWKIARFYHASWFGYVQEDWKTLDIERRMRIERREKGEEAEAQAQAQAPFLRRRRGRGCGEVGLVGLRDSNTFAYALCDSPVGVLSLVCSLLRRKSPNHQLSNTEILNITQLAWLPGPEGGFAFWTAAMKEMVALEKERGKSVRSKVAVTVFGADGAGYGDDDSDGYFCPAWASRKHDVVFAQRVAGRAGLLAWERPGVLVAGIRGLVKAIQAVDSRPKARPLEELVMSGGEAISEKTETVDGSESYGLQLVVESPDTVVALKLT